MKSLRLVSYFQFPDFSFRIRKIDNFLHLLLNNKGNKAQFVANYAIYDLKLLNDLIFFSLSEILRLKQFVSFENLDKFRQTFQ